MRNYVLVLGTMKLEKIYLQIFVYQWKMEPATIIVHKPTVAQTKCYVQEDWTMKAAKSQIFVIMHGMAVSKYWNQYKIY